MNSETFASKQTNSAIASSRMNRMPFASRWPSAFKNSKSRQKIKNLNNLEHLEQVGAS